MCIRDRSGRDVDKFKELKLTPEYGEITKCPMIKESPVNLECKVVEIKEFGSCLLYTSH